MSRTRTSWDSGLLQVGQLDLDALTASSCTAALSCMLPGLLSWAKPIVRGLARACRCRSGGIDPALCTLEGQHELACSEDSSMSTIAAERVRVGLVVELADRGCTVISAGGHGIAVFAHDGRFFAVDTRCPHMGFPLSRGTVRDGLLTCHWHHARFDLEGGGTLDPFADNVRRFPVEMESGSVYVLTENRPEQTSRTTYWLGRLEEGLEHSLGFVLAKSTIALLSSGVDAPDVVRTIGRYGLRYRARGWGM